MLMLSFDFNLTLCSHCVCVCVCVCVCHLVRRGRGVCSGWGLLRRGRGACCWSTGHSWGRSGRGRSHVAAATVRSSHPARWKPPPSPSCRWRWPYGAESGKTVKTWSTEVSQQNSDQQHEAQYCLSRSTQGHKTCSVFKQKALKSKWNWRSTL